MVKPLSAQLADLSVSAKKAEDAVAAAQKEAHDKLVARREQAHADATAAIQKMDRDINAANDKVVANWNALKAKVAADMDAWNAKIAQFKHDQGIKRAENHAERIEREASFAIDFANAAIEEAKSAVIDAIVGSHRSGKNQGRIISMRERQAIVWRSGQLECWPNRMESTCVSSRQLTCIRHADRGVIHGRTSITS